MVLPHVNCCCYWHQVITQQYKENVLPLVDGLAGDRSIRSKRWSDSKDFLSDSVSICKTFENSYFYIIGEHSIIFSNRKHFKQKAYAELALSQKSGFGQKIDPLMVLLSFFQELKKYEKKHEEEKKCDTRNFLVKKRWTKNVFNEGWNT